MWVVRTTLDNPDSVKAMVARAHANGFNTLIVQVRGRGDAFYKARWEPRAPSIVKDEKFDPLALTRSPRSGAHDGSAKVIIVEPSF